MYKEADKTFIKFRIVEQRPERGLSQFTPEWFCHDRRASNFGWNPCYGANLIAVANTYELALKNINFFAGCIGLFVTKPKEIIHEININDLIDINKDCGKTHNIEKSEIILAELKSRKRRNMLNRALNNNNALKFMDGEYKLLDDLIKYVESLINKK